jgi:ATP-binding cassette subfamily B protein
MKIRYNLPRIDFAGWRRVVRHFGGHLKPHKGRLIISALATLGVSGAALINPWPVKIVFDFILMPKQKYAASPFLAPLTTWDPMNILLLAVGLVMFLAILGGVLSYTRDMSAKTVGHALSASIRLQVFSHAQRLSQSYHDYRETGDLMTRITGDITLIEELLVEVVIRLSGSITLIIGILVAMFFLDWVLALAIMAVLPLFLMAAFRFGGKIKKATRKQREKYGRMVDSVQETFAGISQVKGFAQEKQREKLVGKSVSKDFKANLRTTKLSANYARVIEMISALGTCLVLWLGVRRALAGNISAGDLFIFISYLRSVYKPIQGIARLSTRISKATARGEKVIEILELPPETSDDDSGISAAHIKGDIKMEHVTFSYQNGKPVLCDFGCTIPRGKTTLLIGPTGAGKSTVAKLLLKFYEAQNGMVLLDGKDIRCYRTHSLRKSITSLSQEPFLFRTAIGENIAFGKPEAGREEIEAAARLVGAEEFILNLPQGYNTLVGEGGLTLSGGQRQRISFARAALRNSPVMIFDEPATGLDIHAEEVAMEALRALKPNRTIIVITHRLNFLSLADWVVFIRDGRLVDQGSPERILDRGKDFYEYVNGHCDPVTFSEWPTGSFSSEAPE